MAGTTSKGRHHSRWPARVIAAALCLFSLAPIVAQSPPTNLRVSEFKYASKQHQFIFEWDAATAAAGSPIRAIDFHEVRAAGTKP